MKKITLLFLLSLPFSFCVGQTFTTGNLQLFPEYTVKIDVVPSSVTLTQIMPSNRWYALAFDNNGMADGDVVAFINTANISDRQLSGFNVPAADANQNWTTISNTVEGTIRTVVSTRALNTGEAGDYVFSATAGSINLAAARGSTASFNLAAHGGSANAVSTSSYAVTLANEGFDLSTFKIYPNPSKGLTNIELPTNVSVAKVKLYDTLGKMVMEKEIAIDDATLDTSSLQTGSYLLVLRTDYGNVTKNLLIE